jgi:hypothetical protein
MVMEEGERGTDLVNANEVWYPHNPDMLAQSVSS